MSTAFTHFSTLIEALNARAGLALRCSDGACAFYDSREAYWQISLGQGSDMLVIACTLGDLSAWPEGAALRMLALNTRHDILQGAALGVDPDTREVRLMLLLPMSGLQAPELQNALLNLMATRDTVIEALAQTDGKSTAPAPAEPAGQGLGLPDFA